MLGRNRLGYSECEQTALCGRIPKRRCINAKRLCLALLLGAMSPTQILAGAVDEPLSTYLDQKYSGVVPQTAEYSCGAAALACLLALFGIPAGEHEVLDLVEEQMAERGEPSDSERGLSALDLRDAASSMGLRMVGYLLSIQQLEDYFARAGFPVIAHVTRPRKHYVVVVAAAERHVMIGDPGWGAYVSTMRQFAEERGPSGVFIVAMPTEEQAAIARQAQAALLERVAQRVACLRELRNGILP